MELKEFVSNALTQIAQGVQEAIDASNGKGYLVSPSNGNNGNTHTVHFDLSVETEKEGKANIRVVAGGVSERSTNRISFDIPMSYPSSGKKEPPTRPVYDDPCKVQNIQSQ